MKKEFFLLFKQLTICRRYEPSFPPTKELHEEANGVVSYLGK